MQDEPALLHAAKILDPDALVAMFDLYAPPRFTATNTACAMMQ
jgi:hypothetical protein